MVTFAVLPQYLLPKRWLTRLAGRAAGARLGDLTHAAIRRFVARYGVDMSEAANPDPASYPTFNAFFTRPLRPDARPLADADFMLNEFIDRFGPRMAHLNGVLQVLSALSNPTSA